MAAHGLAAEPGGVIWDISGYGLTWSRNGRVPATPRHRRGVQVAASVPRWIGRSMHMLHRAMLAMASLPVIYLVSHTLAQSDGPQAPPPKVEPAVVPLEVPNQPVAE